MPNKYFQIDGFATFVHHLGATTLPDVPPELSRGEAMLCLHGAGGNGAQFDELMPRLDAHSPIAFDQPGHGRSGGLDSLGSIERMAGFAQAFCDKLGLPPRVLVGHSMGGAVAMRMALDAPDQVRALVLVGSAGHFPIPDDAVEQSRLVTEGKARREFRREVFSPNASPEVMRRNFMEDLKTDPRAGHGDLLALREFDVRDRLGELQMPTLVIRGDAEMLAPLCDELAEKIPGAKRVVVPDAGHILPLERPDALAAEIQSFLAEAL